jgi:hypothetical protein
MLFTHESPSLLGEDEAQGAMMSVGWHPKRQVAIYFDGKLQAAVGALQRTLLKCCSSEAE